MSQHTYTHDSAGRRETATRENGEAWGYTYNSRSEVTGGSNVSAGATPTAKPGHTFGYSYDGLGNRLSTAEDTPEGLVSMVWEADETNALLNREHAPSKWVMGKANPAATVTVNGGAATRDAETGEFRAALSADDPPAADWQPVEVQAVLAGAGKTGGDITVKREGHLWFAASPEEFFYDEDGNLLHDGRWLYRWDGENRLIAMETATGAVLAGVPEMLLEFGYDGQSRRIQKKVYLEEESESVLKSDLRFIYDGWNLVAELEFTAPSPLPAPRLVRAYAWGVDLSNSEQGAGGVGGLLAVEHLRSAGLPGAVWLPCYDGNGNITAYLDAATGALEEQHDYDPFGNEVVGDFDGTLAGLNCPFGFSTKYTDGETELCYYGYRYYAPETGRFLSSDPVTELGFNSIRQTPRRFRSKLGDAMNCYRFVNNSPVNAYDLLGLELQWHHMLPQAIFDDAFMNRHGIGIRDVDIHSAEYGWELDDHYHQRRGGIHPRGWNDDWSNWVAEMEGRGDKIDKCAIDTKLESMKRKYSQWLNLGRKAKAGYPKGGGWKKLRQQSFKKVSTGQTKGMAALMMGLGLVGLLEGEVDGANTAKVEDIRDKYEWLIDHGKSAADSDVSSYINGLAIDMQDLFGTNAGWSALYIEMQLDE